MHKSVLACGLAVYLLLNLFSGPISMLVFEVNRHVQKMGSGNFQEMSITICVTTCTIQKELSAKQLPATAEQSSRISYVPLTLFWQAQNDSSPKIDQLALDRYVPVSEGHPLRHTSAIFVPPRVA